MTNDALAADYLKRAGHRLKALEVLVREQSWADVVREAQELVEITLKGLVLPIGGVKEKVLAAHRAGFKRVILPRENESNLRDLPADVRAETEFVFVDRIEEVLREAVVGHCMPIEGEPESVEKT